MSKGGKLVSYLIIMYIIDSVHITLFELAFKCLINICLTSLTRAKCGVRSTLCWKNLNISGSIKLFAL